MPLAKLDFLNDPNIQLRGLSASPFQRTLNAGTTTFSFIPVTRSAGISLRVTDTNATGTFYSTDTVTNAAVQANLPLSLLVQMPGETYAEGTVFGKTGSASTLIAGDLYNVTLRAVDLYNNRASDGRQVLLSANDIYAVVPPVQSLAIGQTVFSGFLASAATGNLVISGVDFDLGALTGQALSGISVVPGTPDRLMVVLNGETLVPGKNIAPFGVSGIPTESTATVPFTATVYATDSRYNVSTVTLTDGSSIKMTSNDTFAPNVGVPVSLSAGAASFAPIQLRTAGARTLTATHLSGGGPALAAGVSNTFNYLPFNPTNLRTLTPSESRVPGSTTNGRSGPAFTVQAGFSFTATVDITDSFWNLTPGATHQIRLVADDPFAVIVPTTQVITTSATYTVTLKRAGTTILRSEPVVGVGLTANNSTPITVQAGTPTRLLTIVTDSAESASQGSPTGKSTPTGSLTNQTAGTGFNIRVGVVDGFFNLVPGRAADVLVTFPSDPYASAVSTVPINTATGLTDPLLVTLRLAVTDHYLIASDFGSSGLANDPQSSTFTVLPAAPKGIQLLLPGQFAVPGAGNYPLGGVAGAISTPTAGAPFLARVTLVDQYMNISPHPTTPLLVYLNTNDPSDVETASGPTASSWPPGQDGVGHPRYDVIGVTLVTKSTLTVSA